MDTASYKSLIAKTQEALSNDAIEKLQDIPFAILLKDFIRCLNQSLDVVTELLSEAEVCITKLTEYLRDAVGLLELLPKFIKTIIGSDLMTCCTMETFPNAVGTIILTVFSHCKDSESIYGSSLSSVKKPLKDLFRSCHELQIIYLTVLDKHFVFDPTDTEKKNVLLEALNINLRIVETVHSLDVKPLAVQWKSMIIIYEKYSAVLSDTSIFQDCMEVLCPLIKRNIKTAVEANQDDKVFLRSLKVAKFLLKILVKVCDIFRHATLKEYNNVVCLLFYVYETSAQLQLTAERSQFINLVASPSDCLLKELLYDETFGNSLLDSDIAKIKKDGNFLGFVITMTSVMDCLTQGQNYRAVSKSKVINCLYRILRECNPWNLDVTLYTDDQKSHGLFDHLLIHALALAMTLNCEEFGLLETNMIEALLSTDHVSALFSCNIWALLHKARDINPELLFNQIVGLSTIYKKSEKHCMFDKSPQKIYLTHTMTRLFSLMENDDKMKICKLFRIHDDDNISLWAALGVKSLPPEAKNAAEAVVAEGLEIQFQSLSSNIRPEKIDKMTKLISLAATCTFSETSGIEDFIMKAWSKTCPEQPLPIRLLQGGRGTVWFYDYLQALIALTDSMWQQMCFKNVNLIKILHYVTVLIQGGVEIQLLLIKILCKIATTDICDSKLSDITAAFSRLYHNEEIVRKQLLITLKQYTHRNIDRILSNVDENWSEIKDRELKDMKELDFKYTHKCFESRSMIESLISSISDLAKESSDNFDFDNLIGNDSDLEESVCKKAKIDSSQVETVIKTLEKETALLRTMKENIFSAESRSRIQRVCDELNNIIN